MANTSELEKGLNELKRLTGITLTVTAEDSEQEQMALEQIRCLCLAYREKYNKNDFLMGLMTGGVPSYDVQQRAARLHIAPEENRILFLIEIKEPDEIIGEILKNLFPSQTKAYIVPVSKERLAVLYPFHETKDSKDSADEHARHLAHAIVDTLNAEALAHVQVSFSQMIPSLLELSGAFREASLALKVGKLFYPEQTVFPYNELGIGRLIYQLPVSLCESFLQEVFLDKIPDKLDDETLLTINRFLQNNLNIAETSRQLHMHRNTLIYRLEQIEKRTGLDLRQFEDAMTFKIATMVMNYLHAEKKNCTEM
jgi:carbohydrate diacid regulator